jgi:hypothetical protein
MDKIMKVKRVRILSVHSSSEVDRSVGVSALSDAGHVTEAAMRAKETLNRAFPYVSQASSLQGAFIPSTRLRNIARKKSLP